MNCKFVWANVLEFVLLDEHKSLTEMIILGGTGVGMYKRDNSLLMYVGC